MPWMVHFLNSFSFKIFLIYQYHDFSVDFKLRVDFSVLTIWPLPSSFLCGNFGHVSFSLCVSKLIQSFLIFLSSGCFKFR